MLNNLHNKFIDSKNVIAHAFSILKNIYKKCVFVKLVEMHKPNGFKTSVHVKKS